MKWGILATGTIAKKFEMCIRDRSLRRTSTLPGERVRQNLLRKLLKFIEIGRAHV